MALIGKEVESFVANAFHQDKFITISKDDLLGKWSSRRILLLSALRCLWFWHFFMINSKKSTAKCTAFQLIHILFTKHGKIRQKQFRR